MHDRSITGKWPLLPLYHGWLVVAAAFLVALYGFGLGFYGPGIYFVALKALHGWPIAELSSEITTYYVLGATLLFFWVGPLFDRHGARKIVLMGTVAMASGTVLLALVNRPWHVYAAFAVMSVGWATMSGGAINIIVAPWFDGRRGLALSWALNGGSAGGIIIAPLLTFLTTRFGLAIAMESVSASMLAILIPVAIVVLRPRRSDEYDPVEGADPNEPGIASPAEASGFRLITVLSSGVFISISVPFALGLTAQVGFLTHQIAFLAPTVYFGERKGGFWVAIENDKLVGTFGLERASPDAMELRRMYVDPGARRRWRGCTWVRMKLRRVPYRMSTAGRFLSPSPARRVKPMAPSSSSH
jgi:MFS family permease